MLILDGHGSHCTIEFFQYCIEHNIYPICLPSHSTHLLQPLDVGLFGLLKKAYSTELDKWHRRGNNAVRKGNFHECVFLLQIRELTFQRLAVRARDTAYTEENIKKAFESTGIHPLNPRMVLGKLKPERSGGSQNVTRPDNNSECRLYKPPMYLVGGSEGSLLSNTSSQITGYEPGVNSINHFFFTLSTITERLLQNSYHHLCLFYLFIDICSCMSNIAKSLFYPYSRRVHQENPPTIILQYHRKNTPDISRCLSSRHSPSTTSIR